MNKLFRRPVRTLAIASGSLTVEINGKSFYLKFPKPRKINFYNF